MFSQLLFPPEPLALVRRAEASALGEMARGVVLTARALEHDDDELAGHALDVLRDLRDRLAELAHTPRVSDRVGRHSLRWRSLSDVVVREHENAGHLDLLGGSCLLVARTAPGAATARRAPLATEVRALAVLLRAVGGRTRRPRSSATGVGGGAAARSRGRRSTVGSDGRRRRAVRGSAAGGERRHSVRRDRPRTGAGRRPGPERGRRLRSRTCVKSRSRTRSPATARTRYCRSGEAGCAGSTCSTVTCSASGPTVRWTGDASARWPPRSDRDEAAGWWCWWNAAFCSRTPRAGPTKQSRSGRTPGVRVNEGACDPDGRLYAASMAFDQRPHAATLYRLDPDG